MTTPAPTPTQTLPGYNTATHSAAFDAQWTAFVAALPELIAAHHGSWVVWLDGVQGVFDDQEAAYAFMDTKIPLHAPVVVAPAEEQRTHFMGGFSWGASAIHPANAQPVAR